MKTNYETLDQGRINRTYYARLIRVLPSSRIYTDYVVAVYHDSGKPERGPGLYVSQMNSVHHFSNEVEATQYFLALMDPNEFGDPEEILARSTSLDATRTYHWSPSVDVAKALEAESFRREVAR